MVPRRATRNTRNLTFTLTHCFVHMFTDVFAHMYIQFSSYLLQLSTPIHFSTWHCLQMSFFEDQTHCSENMSFLVQNRNEGISK